MAVRQYIGARYTTKIYENSLNPGSAEWEAGATYEPLTLVTYLNGSYLSKKEVPGNVGNPPANPEYWVVTGAYNGQIAALQNAIDNINNVEIPDIENDIDIANDNITNLQNSINNITKSWLDNKVIYVFGDSLASPKTGGIFEYLAEYVPSATINNHAIGATDYSQIAAEISTTDISDADVVIILGGTNNWQGNTSLDQFYTHVKNAVTNIKSQNATAKIILMTPPFSWSSNFPSGSVNFPNVQNLARCRIPDYGNIIKKVAREYGADVIDLYECAGIGNVNYTSAMENSGSGGSTIYVHPLAYVNKHIAELILDECYNNTYATMLGTLTAYFNATDISVTEGGTVAFNPNDGQLSIAGTVVTGNSPSAPSGYQLTLNLPYGTQTLFSLKYSGYRIMILDYSTMSVKSAQILLDSNHYTGDVVIEGGTTANSIYVFAE